MAIQSDIEQALSSLVDEIERARLGDTPLRSHLLPRGFALSLVAIGYALLGNIEQSEALAAEAHARVRAVANNVEPMLLMRWFDKRRFRAHRGQVTQAPLASMSGEIQSVHTYTEVQMRGSLRMVDATLVHPFAERVRPRLLRILKHATHTSLLSSLRKRLHRIGRWYRKSPTSHDALCLALALIDATQGVPETDTRTVLAAIFDVVLDERADRMHLFLIFRRALVGALSKHHLPLAAHVCKRFAALGDTESKPLESAELTILVSMVHALVAMQARPLAKSLVQPWVACLSTPNLRDSHTEIRLSTRVKSAALMQLVAPAQSVEKQALEELLRHVVMQSVRRHFQADDWVVAQSLLRAASDALAVCETKERVEAVGMLLPALHWSSRYDRGRPGYFWPFLEAVDAITAAANIALADHEERAVQADVLVQSARPEGFVRSLVLSQMHAEDDEPERIHQALDLAHTHRLPWAKLLPLVDWQHALSPLDDEVEPLSMQPISTGPRS